MKKWFIVLAAVMLLGLTACGKTNSTNAADLERTFTEAIAKTTAAKSYVIQYGTVSEYQGYKNEDLTTVMLSKDSNGTITALSTDSLNYIIYVCGNVAYHQGSYSFHQYIKHLSNVPFGVDIFLSEYSEFFLNKNFLKDFVGQTPAITETDNETVYTISGPETVYQVLMGTPLSEDQIAEMYGIPIEECTFSLYVSVDGYFTGFAMTHYWREKETDILQSNCVMLSFDKLNTEVTIEEPAFVAHTEQWEAYHIHENGYEAVYEWDYTEEARIVYEFRGMENDYSSTQIVPIYKVLSEIEGMPVVRVTDVSTNMFQNTAYIEKLVLPEGVSFWGCSGEDRPKTEIYFESPREHLNNRFYTMEEEKHGEDVLIKAAYYAGEWEYVDGIPTPIQ